MSELFVTSDTHFCHASPTIWKNRGFSSIDAMNEALIKKWNKKVKKNDIVYHLGDVIVSDARKDYQLLKRLNGKLIFIIGNHDPDTRIKLLFSELGSKIEGGMYATRFKANGTPFYVSHFPTITAKFDNKLFSQHIVGLHGHIHGKTHWMDIQNPFVYDVGVDSCGFAPISLEEVMVDIRKKWDEMKK